MKTNSFALKLQGFSQQAKLKSHTGTEPYKKPFSSIFLEFSPFTYLLLSTLPAFCSLPCSSFVLK